MALATGLQNITQQLVFIGNIKAFFSLTSVIDWKGHNLFEYYVCSRP